MASVRLKIGKGAYVRRQLASGDIEQVCLCGWNADFSAGCASLVHGSLMQEVIENEGGYNESRLKEHKQSPGTDHRCSYCYGRRKNRASVCPLKIDNKTRKDFKEHSPEVVRLGMKTESLHPYYLQTFLEFLRLCEEFKVGLIMPTKAFPFGREGLEKLPLREIMKDFTPASEELVDRLQEVRHVVNYSIGNDKLELGMVSQGFTNEWRIRQALNYREAGINATLTITCDVTSSLDENSGRGFAVRQALEASAKNRIPVRILPLRITSKRLAILATGMSWRELKRGSVLKSEPPSYSKRGNNELYPLRVHQDFQELVKRGVGVCGRVGAMEYCDKCQLYSPEERIVFPAKELAVVKYPLEFYRQRREWNKRRRDNETPRGKSREGKPANQNLFLGTG